MRSGSNLNAPLVAHIAYAFSVGGLENGLRVPLIMVGDGSLCEKVRQPLSDRGVGDLAGLPGERPNIPELCVASIVSRRGRWSKNNPAWIPWRNTVSNCTTTSWIVI
jgi:hypothetical protein